MVEQWVATTRLGLNRIHFNKMNDTRLYYTIYGLIHRIRLRHSHTMCVKFRSMAELLTQVRSIASSRIELRALYSLVSQSVRTTYRQTYSNTWASFEFLTYILSSSRTSTITIYFRWTVRSGVFPLHLHGNKLPVNIWRCTYSEHSLISHYFLFV